jgi:hypothetical protein
MMPRFAPRRPTLPHRLLVIGAAAAAALVAIPSSAHHSTAMFDWGKSVDLKGATVVRWDWTNPHTFLYVTVPNAGKSDTWAFEGMSPNHLGRIGWSKRTLKAGDKIDLTYYPLKDGRKGGFNVTVTFADGKVMKQLESPSTNPANDR